MRNMALEIMVQAFVEVKAKQKELKARERVLNRAIRAAIDRAPRGRAGAYNIRVNKNSLTITKLINPLG